MVATVLPQPADNVLLRRTGLDNVRIAARHRLASVDPAKLRDVIDAVGIGDFAERTCATMSGGEQQRVALACALVGGTPLVLADEPTGALDAVSAATVIDALVRIAATGTTIVAATHDPHVIAAASTVIRLDHGRRVG